MIEVYVAVSVGHITRVSVHDGDAFIPVYEATASADASSQVLTIVLDSVCCIIDELYVQCITIIIILAHIQ